MSEVSNSDIYNVLINMRGDIGRLEGKMDGHAQKLTEHIEDDKILTAAIQKLQSANDRQRGFVAAIATIGAVMGAALGAIVDLVARGHH
jgi:hypothetical protein